MIPQERAEKINKMISGFHSPLERENFIAAQIAEAEREAGHAEPDCKTCFKHGFSAAQEKAKGIAEGRKFYDPEGWLAEAIAKMEPEK